jgi:hypothetical protein
VCLTELRRPSYPWFPILPVKCVCWILLYGLCVSWQFHHLMPQRKYFWMPTSPTTPAAVLPPSLSTQAYPEEDEALSYHHGLPMAVDALAKGVEQCDSAFYLLESWAEQVGVKRGSGRTGMCGWIPLCRTVLTTVPPMRRLSACILRRRHRCPGQCVVSDSWVTRCSELWPTLLCAPTVCCCNGAGPACEQRPVEPGGGGLLPDWRPQVSQGCASSCLRCCRHRSTAASPMARLQQRSAVLGLFCAAAFSQSVVAGLRQPRPGITLATR